MFVGFDFLYNSLHAYFLGNIKLLFSKKSVVWSNGTVVFYLPIESSSYLKLSISDFIIVFLVSISSQSRLLSFTCLLLTPFLAFMSRILFRNLQISFIRESFNSHNSAFNKENGS